MKIKLKKVTIILIALLLNLSPLAPASANLENEVIIEDPTPDTIPPTLESLSIVENSTGKSYKLLADISDDLSGVDYVYGSYKSPKGTYSKGINFYYNSSTNKYEATIYFTEYDESGIWDLSSVTLRDKKNNSMTVYDQKNNSSGVKMDLSPYSIEIVGGLEDTIAPELNSIDITPKSEVTAGASIKVEADITDIGSGVETVNVSFLKPSKATKSLSLYYNNTTGKYQGSFSIDQYDELGAWKLFSVSLRDNARNSRVIYDSILNTNDQTKMDFSELQFTVKETTPDLLEPILESLAIKLEQSSNNTALIKLTADGSDNLSGLYTLDARYIKPSGKSLYVNFYKNYTTNKFEAIILIDKYDELGTWKLSSMTLRDSKGNYVAIMDGLQNYKNSKDFSPFYFTVSGVITIPPPTPFSITTNVKSIKLEPSDSFQLEAILNMSDDSSKDVTLSTTGTTFSSSNPNLVSVSKNGLITVNANAKADTVYIQVSNSKIYSQVKVEIAGGTTDSYLQTDPIEMSLSSGQTKQLNVLAYLADGTAKNVTTDNEISYTSSNEAMVTVNSMGVVQVLPGVEQGTAKIQIVYNDLKNEVVVIVTGPPTIKSISMTPKEGSLKFGETAQINVRATMSDGTSKEITKASDGTVYQSSDETKAIVDENGLVKILDTALSGKITIKAINSNLIAQSILNISGVPVVTEIAITPGEATLKPGESQTLKVIAKYSDGEEKEVRESVSFRSLNSALAIVNENGLITIPEDSTGGTVSIVGIFEGKTATSSITIPTKPVLESLIFTPDKTTVNQKEELQLVVEANYSDGTKIDVTSQVIYSSSNETIATVDKNGLVTVSKDSQGGTVYIRGSFGGKGGATTVTIPKYTPPTVTKLEFTAANLEVKAGESTQVKVVATYSDGTTEDVTAKANLSSSNISQATVDPTSGIVSALVEATGGTIYIRGSYGGKGGAAMLTIPSKPPVSKLTFTPETLTLKNGESVEVKVIATYTDGTTEDVTSIANLNSSNTLQAKVDPTLGIVSVLEGATGGTVYIKGSYGGKGGATTLIIPKPPYITGLLVTPSTQNLKPVDEITLKVIANYSDGSSKDVTVDANLKSTNNNLALVNSTTGLVTIPANAPNGTVYIQASYGGKGGSATLKVSKPYITGISFSQAKDTIKLGESLSVKVVANYSDGSTEDVTSKTIFSSSNDLIANVDSIGNVTIPASSKGGTVYIRGTYGGKGGASTLTVLGPPTVSELVFTSSNSILNKDEEIQVYVTAIYSDGTSKDVTNDVSFSSSNVSLATVDNSGKVTLAENAKSGTVYIRGSYEGKGGSTTIVIPPQPYIVKLEFDPLTTTLSKGSTFAIKVNAIYSNGVIEDVTSKVAFSSSNLSIATVSETGLVSISSTTNGRTVYIRGTYGGKGAASTVTIQ
ncbi:hypothetical protein A9986_07570 [Solibacillus silvestris]|nr:Ig-like domain-containing protein [Solibacillus silvestris]OBW58795.1 hypothetical protein A9986_07570 [Solibacillus silvestris]